MGSNLVPAHTWNDRNSKAHRAMLAHNLGFSSEGCVRVGWSAQSPCSIMLVRMAMAYVLRVVAATALFFVLPGYLVWVAVGGQGAGRRQVLLPTFVFEVVLTSALWTGWLGVLLLQVARFSFRNLAAGTALLTVGLSLWSLRRRRAWLPRIRRSTLELVLLGVLLALAAALFFHPHEFVVGGADAGVYVNLGAAIASNGSWVTQNAVIADVDPGLYSALFRQQPPDQTPMYIQFPGFYLTDPGAGEITPQFYPLHASWLALLNAVGGVRLSLYATPLWGILGAWSVAIVAEALFGRRCGLLSMALLCLTATQIWFSRYPTSEVLTQYLLFGGMWALIQYFDGGSLWYGFLAEQPSACRCSPGLTCTFLWPFRWYTAFNA